MTTKAVFVDINCVNRKEVVMMKRFMMVILLAGLVISLSTVVFAQTYPSKPIKIVVPFGPGAPSDAMARLLGERAGKVMGATFFAENKEGASGMLAARAVVQSPPDGYTIMVSSNSAHAANMYLFKEPNYHPVRDFAPITGLSQNPHVLVSRATLPVKTIQELIQYGKANPGKLNFGSGNTGGLANASLFSSLAGFTAVHIPYKSAPAAVVDLLAGRIDFLFIDFFVVDPHIKAGTLLPLAVSSSKRLKILPNVPTIADTIPGYELTGWLASFAPAGTPADIVGKLNKAFIQVITAPELQEYMERQGWIPDPTTPEQLGNFVKEQIVKWADVLQKAGVERQ
jgi:tripartite-type tricarboxylate transporter receptor subunit TctC